MEGRCILTFPVSYLTKSRPTALQDFDVTTEFPETKADASGKALIANHCFKLRQLQSKVVDVLHHAIQPYYDIFVEDMQQRIDAWLSLVPINVCSAEMIDWFSHAYHNLCIFLHRPSVAIPNPSAVDIRKCFDSSQEVLRLYWKLYRSDAVDCTWMAIHWLFLAGIVHLYCLWTNEDIRNTVDWSVILEDTQTTNMVLAAMAERWSSAEGVPQAYHSLCIGTFQKYGELYPQWDSESFGPHT